MYGLENEMLPPEKVISRKEAEYAVQNAEKVLNICRELVLGKNKGEEELY